MIVSPGETSAVAAAGPKRTLWRRPELGSMLALAAGWVLLLLAIDRIVRGLAAVVRPVEAMYGEAIIYDQAARLLRGEALYQALGRAPYTVTAYTPLYYTLVAGLHALVGPGFGPGRVLSFAAGVVATLLVGRLAARRVGDWRAGVFAGVLFVGLGFPGDFPWFAFYKEDMLGVALALGALAILDRGSDRRHAAAAGALAGLAFLSKQTFVAAAVAGFCWLWWRNRASAVIFAAAVLVAGIGPCLLAALSSGAFLDNTVRANLNPTSMGILLANLQVLERYQGAALALALLPLLARPRQVRGWLRDPLVPFWLLGLVLVPIGLGKVGSNSNYWIELAAATAVLATRGVWQLVVRAGMLLLGRVAGAVGVLALLASPVWLPAPAADLGSVVDHALHPDERQATEFARVLERVRAEPRAVLAEPLDIVTLAGRSLVLEPYIFSILNQQGQWDATPLVRQICTGQVGLLVLDHTLGGPDWETNGYNHWPPPVLEALRASMQLERAQAQLYLYVPRSTSSNLGPPEACQGVE